jgi:hypothetical protein
MTLSNTRHMSQQRRKENKNNKPALSLSLSLCPDEKKNTIYVERT